MCNNTKAISFWNFLKENTIEIPIIQRDYAQGRLGKENLRKNFLVDLKNALNSSETMKLDFVYGSTEKDKLNPLDGQQRLTTLWLLHWYIALRAGKLNEDNCKVFRNFTYETRISSREFCQNLCVSNNFKDFEYKDIVGFITKQTWFYSAWKQDPTIQSILRMLSETKDGIEGVLACHGTCLSEKKCQFENYWEKLSGENSPIIFYHLPLKDFGLSDDLYIKMNARGKQLTSFENFKADLIGYITKHAEDKSLNELEWKGLLDVKDGIPIKLDTDWTDIFWKKKSVGITDKESKKRKSNQIDEIFFVFMNRFFWNELFTAKNNDDNYILNIDKENESSIQENSYKYLNNSEYDNDTTIAYGGFDVYRYDNGEISLSFFQKLKRVLDNYFNYSKNNGLPECPWDKSFRFIPEYIEESGNNIEIENNAKVKILKVSTFNQVQRIVFFAVCKYFFHDKDITDNESSLKQWLRVVWNLVSGEDHNGLPEIRSTFVMRTAIKFIDSLDSHKVYESLRNFDINKLGNSSFDERCKKEIAKAIQILGENAEDLRKYTGACKKQDGSNYQTWEEIIIEAEKYAFFKGTIRFLFTDGEGNINWCDFDTKWSNAKKYFAENGIKDEYTTKAILLRSFISKFSKWGDFWGVNYDNEPSTWKLLLTSRFESAHCILTNTVNKNCDFSTYNASLKEFDNGFKELQNSVQKDLVKTTILVEASKWQSKLNWRYNTYCLYPFNNKAEKKVYVIGNQRNQILSSLCDKKQIIVDGNRRFQSGDNDNFFWGWDIQFTYTNKNYYFQWHRNGYVRLIQDLNECKPILKNKDGEDNQDNWYWFTPSTETETFIKQLDCLIAQAYPNESDKTYCVNCQSKICN